MRAAEAAGKEGVTGASVHCGVHFEKGSPGLLEEVGDEVFAEIAIFVALVHLENLRKGGQVDPIPQVRHAERTFVGLESIHRLAAVTD